MENMNTPEMSGGEKKGGSLGIFIVLIILIVGGFLILRGGNDEADTMPADEMSEEMPAEGSDVNEMEVQGEADANLDTLDSELDGLDTEVDDVQAEDSGI